MKDALNLVEERKREHLAPFRSGGAPARNATTWLECVRLVHQALPEIAPADIDLQTRFAGRVFRAPLFVTGMTGGTTEARSINRGIARVAQEFGIGFGLGSQRAMIDDQELATTYDVRDAAPDVFLAGNIGGTQLARLDPDRLRFALERISANALCIHLNPAQELVQREGDRDFRGVLDAVGRAVQVLEIPVIVKEVGCGISRETGVLMRSLGVRYVDATGVGGTSWVGLELMRNGESEESDRTEFWDWGIPTAASIWEVGGLGFDIMASGGIRTGLDIAKSIALGASIAGTASPVIQAWFAGGSGAVESLLNRMLDGLRMAMTLTRSRTVADLRTAPRVVGGPLLEWQQTRSKNWRN